MNELHHVNNENIIFKAAKVPDLEFSPTLNFKIWQKDVTIFRATESRLSAGHGVGPNAGD